MYRYLVVRMHFKHALAALYSVANGVNVIPITEEAATVCSLAGHCIFTYHCELTQINNTGYYLILSSARVALKAHHRIRLIKDVPFTSTVQHLLHH